MWKLWSKPLCLPVSAGPRQPVLRCKNAPLYGKVMTERKKQFKRHGIIYNIWPFVFITKSIFRLLKTWVLSTPLVSILTTVKSTINSICWKWCFHVLEDWILAQQPHETATVLVKRVTSQWNVSRGLQKNPALTVWTMKHVYIKKFKCTLWSAQRKLHLFILQRQPVLP